MFDKISLNPREKRVLSSLIQYPNLSDVEIASIVGVKHSTFATIKKRLTEKKLLKKYYIPNFLSFGAEILTFDIRGLKDYSKSIKDNPIEMLNSPEFLDQFDNAILAGYEIKFSFILMLSKNYSDLSKKKWYLEQLTRKFELTYDFTRSIDFPMRFSEIGRFLDFSKTMTKHLDIDLPVVPFRCPFSMDPNKKFKMTKVGWEIFQSVVKYPNLSPRMIAEKIEKPRTTVTRWLRIFLQSNMMVPRIIPNYKRLGFNIAVLYHISVITPNASVIKKILQIIDDVLCPIVLIQSGHDIFLIGIYSDFETYRDLDSVFVSSVGSTGDRFVINHQYILSLPHTTLILDLTNSIVPVLKYLVSKEDFIKKK
ncbi:MAG: MarR family transcriptional regulator [Candidatus Hodarchaeales archaeon]